MKDLDASYPREMAERRLEVRPGEHSLDDLARALSLTAPEPVSVRDISTKTIRHSRVWLRGEVQPGTPYLARFH